MTMASSGLPAGNWRVGLEVELLAPPDRSRKDLAEAIALACNGGIKRIFHPQSEFAPVDGATVFENLTLGFSVFDASGGLLASCVDDLTLIDDLDATMPSLAGWYRIMSDDKRFLGLVERHCDPASAQIEVLEPLAALFGTEVEVLNEEPVTRVRDSRRASIAMTASLPGERHRPCELVTAPLEANREAAIRQYLQIAENLGFGVPAEAATHIHFDAGPLKSAGAIANLVTLFGHYRPVLGQLVGTNPRCRRLGDWPKELYRTVQDGAFRDLEWEDARKKLVQAKPVKYCDFNIANMLWGDLSKDTMEIRILPGSMDAEFILRCIRLFEALLRFCVREPLLHARTLPDLPELLERSGLDAADIDFWRERHTAHGTPNGLGRKLGKSLNFFR